MRLESTLAILCLIAAIAWTLWGILAILWPERATVEALGWLAMTVGLVVALVGRKEPPHAR
jgi:hypothetical protein